MRKFLNSLPSNVLNKITSDLLGNDVAHLLNTPEKKIYELIGYCKTYRLSVDDLKARYQLT